MDAGAIFSLIPAFAVGGGILYAILNSYWNAKTKWTGASSSTELRAALDANTASNTAVVARLGELDQRLSSVEKTLTDIP